MMRTLTILASLSLSLNLLAQENLSLDLKNDTQTFSISSYEETSTSLRIDEAGSYDIFAIGQAKGELVLESESGEVIGESSIGSLFNQNLKAGTYQLSHIASEVPTAESIDCKDLGKACEWLKSKLFHPEKLTLKLTKSTKIDAHAKPASFLMLDFDGAKRQFVTLSIKEAGTYIIKTSLYNKKERHDNLLI